MMSFEEFLREMGMPEEEIRVVMKEDKPEEKPVEITMTKNEIVKRLEELDREDFFLLMKDVWDSADYRRENEIHAEQRKLKKMLEG